MQISSTGLRALLGFVLASIPVLASDVPGIHNFDRVDNHVYRGGQPSEEGFKYLAKSGVKTVVDLREADSRAKAEERTVTADGMTYVNVPMTGLTPPSEAEIAKLLSLLEDPNSGPVFVHCKRGADRTGAVVAAYHIHHDKWDNSHALADAKAHSMSPFQIPRQNFIRNFEARGSGSAASLAIATAVPATN